MAVCVFVFDILYVDGSPLVHLPLRDRRARLQAALPNLSAGHVQIAHSIELCLSAASIPAADGPQGDILAEHLLPAACCISLFLCLR